jgi:hypothetical protein
MIGNSESQEILHPSLISSPMLDELLNMGKQNIHIAVTPMAPTLGVLENGQQNFVSKKLKKEHNGLF